MISRTRYSFRGDQTRIKTSERMAKASKSRAEIIEKEQRRAEVIWRTDFYFTFFFPFALFNGKQPQEKRNAIAVVLHPHFRRVTANIGSCTYVRKAEVIDARIPIVRILFVFVPPARRYLRTAAP